MKKIFTILVLLALLSNYLVAQTPASRFVNFEQLGIQKEKFINQFGKPIGKDMFYDADNNTIETLLYKEELEKDKTTIITRFTFKNSKLIEQKSEIVVNQIDKKLLDKMSEDLTFIRHRVLLKLQ